MQRMHVENFEDIVSAEKGIFVIKFFSPTCGPCHTMTPVFKALDKNNPELNVYEVDTSASPELAAHFGVRGVPFVTFCENREVLYEFVGVRPLADLQYVVDNINDPYFREHGQFKPAQEQQKSWWFEITIGVSIVVILLAFMLS